MSRHISCTCTVGVSSEAHNHDLEYRQTLEHVHGSKEDIIELIPYESYKDQINRILKPFIDAYNRRRQKLYEAAWVKYNNGLIKNKPRKRDYALMDYDYFTEHYEESYYNRNKNQHMTKRLWRGLIIGLGDKEDRKNNIITREEAIDVIQKLIESWPNFFPALKLLGATIHLDEEGFYHAHIDYFPIFIRPKAEKQAHGIQASHSQEGALVYMGYTPEQSIINATDKVPIVFNAFRNRIYLEVESLLSTHGIRLEYGVSKRKEPTKDSSTNQQLKNWQDTQDGVLEAQKKKNHILDIIENDDVTPEGVKTALKTANELETLLTKVSQQKRSRTNKDNVVVPFSLFDQIQSVIKNIVDAIAHLLQRISVLTDKLCEAEGKVEQLETEVEQQADIIERYKKHNHELQFKINKYCDIKTENDRRRTFMTNFKIDGVPMEQKFKEFLRYEKEK